MTRRTPWILALAWMLGAVALSFWLASSLRVVSNISQFMPQSASHPQLRALESEIEHGPAATLLLMRIHGGTPEQAVRLSKALHAAVNGHTGIIEYIRNGAGQADIGTLAPLQPYAFLLSHIDWSAQGLHRALLARVSDLRAGAGPLLGQYLLADPYLALHQYIERVVGHDGPSRRAGVWYAPGEGALLLVKVRGEALDLDHMQQAIRIVRDQFNALHPAQGVSLDIAGPGAMAVASRAAIQQTIQRLSWVVTGLLLLVFWLAYRSLHLMLLASVPLASATLVGMGLTQLVFGQVHGIVIAFGVTLLGMCMDYPLHLFSHCRHSENAQATMQRIWPTLRLGGISSALAFLVLLGSGFAGLSQLALFAASGVLAALLVTRYLLPAWIRPDWIHPRYLQLKQGFSLRWQVAAVLLSLCLPLAAWLAPTSLWETHVDAISPVPAAARALDGQLRKAMGAANVSHLFVVQAASLQDALTRTEQVAGQLRALVAAKLVTRIEPVTRLLPSASEQRQRQRRIPPHAELVKRLARALKNTPFRREAFAPFLEAARRARHVSPLQLSDLRNTPLYSLARQGLVKFPAGWLSVIRVAGVRSDRALNRWLQAHPALANYHVQTRKAVSALLTSYRKAAAERILLALVLLFALVWFAVRRVRRLARIMLPVILSVLASLSLPLLLGHGLTVFHLLAALLVVGMGLDYSLFFNRRHDLQGEQVQSMHAIGISMLTTVTTFFVLAISSIPVMAAMGTVISAGILLCFLLAWLLAKPRAGQKEVAC